MARNELGMRVLAGNLTGRECNRDWIRYFFVNSDGGMPTPEDGLFSVTADSPVCAGRKTALWLPSFGLELGDRLLGCGDNDPQADKCQCIL